MENLGQCRLLPHDRSKKRLVGNLAGSPWRPENLLSRIILDESLVGVIRGDLPGIATIPHLGHDRIAAVPSIIVAARGVRSSSGT